jgi:DNA-binding FadR family transcriptional regulator
MKWQHETVRSGPAGGGRAAVFAPLSAARRADAVVRRLSEGIRLGLLVPDEQLPSESDREILAAVRVGDGPAARAAATAHVYAALARASAVQLTVLGGVEDAW